MTKMVEGYMRSLYRKARRAEDRPWHRVDAPAMLQRVVGEREGRGRALDLGCGAGTYATGSLARAMR